MWNVNEWIETATFGAGFEKNWSDSVWKWQIIKMKFKGFFKLANGVCDEWQTKVVATDFCNDSPKSKL